MLVDVQKILRQAIDVQIRVVARSGDKIRVAGEIREHGAVAGHVAVGIHAAVVDKAVIRELGRGDTAARVVIIPAVFPMRPEHKSSAARY